jgi:hypothetical protein
MEKIKDDSIFIDLYNVFYILHSFSKITLYFILFKLYLINIINLLYFNLIISKFVEI